MTTRATWRAYIQYEYDDLTLETVGSGAPFQFIDDFVGAGTKTIPSPASASIGYAWVSKTAGFSSGSASVAFVSNAPGGQVLCSLVDSASETAEATLYWNDNLGVNTFNYAAGTANYGQIEFVAQISTLPTTTALIGFGLSSAWVAGSPLSESEYLMFYFNSAAPAGQPNCVALDGSATGAQTVNAGTTDASNAPALVLTTASFHVFRIDFNNDADIAFYVDGNRCNPSGSITWAPGSQAAATMQPMVKIARPSGTGLAAVTVDAVQIFTARNMTIG